MEGRRSALQAHEVRYVLPLGFLKSREELLREFRRAPAGAQLGHEPDLHCNANSAAADMALNHPQLGFLFPHTLPITPRERPAQASPPEGTRPKLNSRNRKSQNVHYGK